jgi:hypothetical protein
MNSWLPSFIDALGQGSVEVYNEFSLQHELGIYLRGLPCFAGKKIQFERNINFFGSTSGQFWTKKEIDISVFAKPANPELAVELKFPRNGQHPESMFSFCKDLRFLEELRTQAGFESCLLLVLADDPLFYQGTKNNDIYSFFRGGKTLTGNISKPTGAKKPSVTLAGQYQVQWQPIIGNLKYFTLTV